MNRYRISTTIDWCQLLSVELTMCKIMMLWWVPELHTHAKKTMNLAQGQTKIIKLISTQSSTSTNCCKLFRSYRRVYQFRRCVLPITIVLSDDFQISISLFDAVLSTSVCLSRFKHSKNWIFWSDRYDWTFLELPLGFWFVTLSSYLVCTRAALLNHHLFNAWLQMFWIQRASSSTWLFFSVTSLKLC